MARKKYKSIRGKIYQYNVITITGVSEDVERDLSNIAMNLGHITLSGLLKPELRKIRDSYSVDMRQDPNAI